MNIPLFLLVLFVGHILGDFYFQSGNMASKKKSKIKWLFAHGAVYSGCIASALLALILFGGVAPSVDFLWIFILASASHIAVDFFKRNAAWENSKWSFAADQAAHLGFLLLAWILWGREIAVGCYIYDYAQHIAIALGLMIIVLPIGLLIESGIIWAFPEAVSGEPQKNDLPQRNASRMIGYLERIIVYFLLLNGEYSAIALVIAAKSIARFPEINNDESFLQANYYIIGTFLSFAAVFAVTVLLGLITPPT